jgi:hypothetical protein
MIAEICLALSLLTAASEKPEPIPTDWRAIITEIHERTVQTRASAKGYFSVKSPFGFVTVSLSAASAPGRFYFHSNRFLMAPAISIVVGRKSTFLLYDEDKWGWVVKSNDSSLITGSLGYDLGMTPWTWAQLLAGRMPKLHNPVAKAGKAKRQFTVMEEDSPDLVYLIDSKEKCLLAVEDKAHGWLIKYTSWQKLPSGDVPTVWRLSLAGDEKLIVHLDDIMDGTKGYSFLPASDFEIRPYPPPKTENHDLRE